MISAGERAQVRQLIEQTIAELEESIPRMEERMGPVSPDSAIGRLSRTDSMINAATVGMALKDTRSRLNRLRNRLLRIDAADFDRCALCGDDLSLARLMAVPDRGVCAACLDKQAGR